MTTFEKINDVLVHLFQEIWELEEKAIITEEFKDITNNDMHIIEAVGLGEGNNMTTIAKKMKITVGSLTTSMNSLVKKHYVERNRSEEDRRIVNITLTGEYEDIMKFVKSVENYSRVADVSNISLSPFEGTKLNAGITANFYNLNYEEAESYEFNDGIYGKDNSFK